MTKINIEELKNQGLFNKLRFRFWMKVRMGEPNGCWIWLAGKKRPEGYGFFHIPAHSGVPQRMVYAHRFSWSLIRGDVPEGLCVLHNCPGGDNPTCVNPNHLWLGTTAENNADKVPKGRSMRGTKNSHNKLTEQNVREIRLRFARERCSTKTLSLEYGVTTQQIRYIIQRKTWGWLQDEESNLCPTTI